MLACDFPHSEEVHLGRDDLIISKTDLKGRITYANRTFMSIAGFSEEELLSQPHNLIRHPDMPKGVFKFLWQELKAGKEFFGFVKNLTRDGQYYWVFANITPDKDVYGNTQGYFSVRRCPGKLAIKHIEPVYQTMREIEARYTGANAARHSLDYLDQLLNNREMTYEELVISLQAGKTDE
ncbi:PAS domain-containing protein [Oceanospirillum sediminis]|uniref:PAS domain-containing protein n=1 Tax=Oceanospirillum sediminis TaxID=2760088 RepID=A0A839IVZ1_9GAMM|nr:PAS domain-containing protein [Oceanospirillum sediminis]MBB1488547.1 PAS domain-containing protein [Oceanospirillum sediminis]